MEENLKDTAGVREGDILAGKYRIDKVLGVGGMGVVVAAHHIQLDDRVAIKFMLPSALANREAVARFAREARAAVKIKSEHVARVSDVGTLDNGAPYMVMEFLEGGDLSDWVTRRGRLSVEQASDFVLQACEAIAEAHALGIVHRDLKPANLFVVNRPDGTLSVKVLDFGISKGGSLSGSDMSMTKTSAMMGSPLYMSPEQMQSAKDADARSDIWALGVILYELVIGETPFAAESLPELILKLMTQPPPSMRAARPDVPPGFEAVVLRSLERDRGRRYQTVGELAVALMDFAPRHARVSVQRISGVLQGAGLATTALPPSSERPREPAGRSTAAAWGQTAGPLEPKRLGLVTGATIGTVVLAGAGIFFAMTRAAEPELAQPSPAPPAEHTVSPAAPAALPPPAVAPALPPAPAAEATAPSVTAPLAQPEGASDRKTSDPRSARTKTTSTSTQTRAPSPVRPAATTAPARPRASAPTTTPKKASAASLFDDRK